jgi:hypothetical protein
MRGFASPDWRLSDPVDSESRCLIFKTTTPAAPTITNENTPALK